MTVAIGIHIHAEPGRLVETISAVRRYAGAEYQLVLLPDGPDAGTNAALPEVSDLSRSGTDEPRGAAACLNRLARETTAGTLVLLESGTIVGPGWLDHLLAALDADPRNGIATPSTNRAWNQLAAFPNATEADIARTAVAAVQRFSGSVRSLAPLWDVGDFCLAIRREVIDAIGPADEEYGLGPCWEMDYAVRAARTGFRAVWAQSAYVFRHPFTARRQQEEARLMEANRRRYQDKFCGLRLSGASHSYHAHCRGEACGNFAPTGATAAAAAPPAAGSLDGPPLVSCIMPTNGRPEWMMQAICYFLRQDYPQRELVIIDASRESLGGMLPADPRIRHIRAPAARSIGAMRNLACEHALGDIVIHWDDDDWYAPNRISTQVRPILDGSADISALHDTCFFDLDTWAFWRCTPEHHRRLFVRDVHGGTLAFRKALFRDGCRYPEVSLAEDAEFLQRALRCGGRLRRLSGEGLFVYLRHGRNAWAFPCGQYLGAAGWLRGTEPACLEADRDFYLARSRNPPDSVALAPPPTAIDGAPRVAIGVHLHAEPERLMATLAAVRANTPPGYSLLLLPDGPDLRMRAALSVLRDMPQSGTETPQGAAACLNRLTRATSAKLIVLLESGTVVGPGWLEALQTALDADPRHGIACPSTNRAWNQLAAFPDAGPTAADIAATVAAASRRYDGTCRSLAPLWDVGDFCLAIRRDVVAAVGAADEAYGPGPCWEMDYAVRAARAGFISVWAQSAYVYRHPFTERRRREEARLMDTNRRRYQDKFCGLLLSGARTGYFEHCRGEVCRHFAPTTPPASVSLAPAPAPAPGAPAIVTGRPMVSCIMPTSGRRRFVPQSIRQFLEQDYPYRELLVLDDGSDPVADLMPSDPRIHYSHQATRQCLGSKRNAACDQARGDIIVHWDDDDWYAPWRLSYQVAELEQTGAVICGLDRMLFVDEVARSAWEYVYPPGGTPWVYGATFCYRRALWQRNRFPDVNVGEDTHFVFAAAGQAVRILERREFFVGRIHPGNISPKQTRDPRWQPRAYDEVRALIG
jgi:glycosyltransferase involved in cell wall biosynthesis